MTDDVGSTSVQKYKGPTRDHPLMKRALMMCDNRPFAEALCDFIDTHAGVSGMDTVDALRIVAGTLCDMQWMLKR
jgi:hypothetical protein